MTRKVIIDCDPGIDDAVALCLGLFDPRLEVVAVTAVAGNVPAPVASRNVQAVIAHLDPARYPRMGAAAAADHEPDIDATHLHGDDGLGNSGLASAQLHHRHPSDKVICDAIRGAPDEVTLVCLGPLTNVARAFHRDPTLPTLVDRILIMGGAVHSVGNITPTAEFNTYYDPESARSVFKSATTKTLIPLDVTEKVVFDIGLLEELPPETTRAGALLHKIIPYAFRAHHQALGREGIVLHDAVALVAALNAELFTTEDMAGDVETRGELTLGATVFDRRPHPEWRLNMEVAREIDAAAVRDCIVRGLKFAGQSSS